MRNKIIEKTIEEVITESRIPKDSKKALSAYIKNMFSGNANSDDLRKVLDLIDLDEDE